MQCRNIVQIRPYGDLLDICLGRSRKQIGGSGYKTLLATHDRPSSLVLV